MVWLRRASYGSPFRHGPDGAYQSPQDDSDAKARVLGRLDELRAFFEVCPFFEDEESRGLLLDKLRDEGCAWEEQSLEEIVAHHAPS